MNSNRKVSFKDKVKNLFKKNTGSNASLQTPSSPEPTPHLREPPQLTLDIRSNYRDYTKQEDNPFLEHPKTGHVKTLKRTNSFRNLKTKYTTLKRSSSRRFNNNRKPVPVTPLSEIKIQPFVPDMDYDTEIEDFTNDVSTDSIFENSLTVSHTSYFHDITPTDESYTDIYNNIYGYGSVDSSLISNKENIPPSAPQYVLSESKTPNYSITPQTPKLLCTPVFEKRSQLDQELCNKFISKLTKSPTENENPFINHQQKDKVRRLPPPRLAPPKHSLPKTPCSPPLNSISPASAKLLRTYRDLANEPNTPDISIDENSLFDALSNVEWWDCSRVTMKKVNNAKPFVS